MLLTPPTRTDRLMREVLAQLERHRPFLDAGAPFSQVTITVRLHRDGNVRGVQVEMQTDFQPGLSEPERGR